MDNPENTKLSFNLKVKKKISFKGEIYYPETSLWFCDYSLIQVDVGSLREHRERTYQGFDCDQVIAFTKKGRLCSCRLAKDAKVEGVLIPKGADITLSKGQVTTVAIRAKEYGATPPITYYKIRKKKLVPFPEGEFSKCNYEE